MRPATHPRTRGELGINRLFRIHLAGVGGSNLADGVIAGALPLIAIALTRDRSSSACDRGPS